MLLLPNLAPAVRSVAVRAQEQWDVVVLSLLNTEYNDGLREESARGTKVAFDVEAQRPARGAIGLAENSIDGGIGRRVPQLDTAIGVGGGFELLIWVGAALEGHADALCWAASSGVEDVAGDGVLGGHDSGDDWCGR